MSKVMVMMSGGVDSSVAAAVLRDQGHDVTGVTLKLWGGESDSGCCSVADVEDARRVAAQLGIPHYVFNLTEDFESAVVAHYVGAYAAGRTPNPCVECNRSIKFGRLAERAAPLGFGALAPGERRYVLDVDPATATVTIGRPEELLRPDVALEALSFVDAPPEPGVPLLVQVRAHGHPVEGTLRDGVVRFTRPQPRVAPGQV